MPVATLTGSISSPVPELTIVSYLIKVAYPLPARALHSHIVRDLRRIWLRQTPKRDVRFLFTHSMRPPRYHSCYPTLKSTHIYLHDGSDRTDVTCDGRS
jgi:hypothetical protein